MSISDPIADMLTRIRNGQRVSLPSVSMPSSTKKESIAKVLLDEGYIASYRVEPGENNKPVLQIELKYFEGRPVIDEIRRVSRSGLRITMRCLCPLPLACYFSWVSAPISPGAKRRSRA